MNAAAFPWVIWTVAPLAVTYCSIRTEGQRRGSDCIEYRCYNSHIGCVGRQVHIRRGSRNSTPGGEQLLRGYPPLVRPRLRNHADLVEKCHRGNYRPMSRCPSRSHPPHHD
ncbi:hypothetical protein B0H13DRAFT_828455 [Mycena leptocephala]|nr:hypothetical protein B0H13DRAFT_828455 [Mycena leptocephala]